MAYIRNFNQADWFFNPGKVPGGLEPTGAAAPSLLTPKGAPSAPPKAAPSAPPKSAPSGPAPLAPVSPAPPAAAPSGPAPAESEAASPAEAPDATEKVPVLETKGTPIGLYILGGVGVLVLGIFLYKKFGGGEEASEEKAAPALESKPVAAKRKKK